jgi:hypothetical protein
MNKRPVRLTTTGANAVVATALVFEILSRWSVFRGGLRRRRLRGSPSKRGRRGLHGLWLRGPTACPVGADHAHEPEQANFLMRAFLRGQAGG